MSEAFDPHHEASGFLPPGHEADILQKPGGLDGPLLDSSAELAAVYPSYTFDIKLDRIIGGVLEATPASRSRYWARILADTCRLDYPELTIFQSHEVRLEQTTKAQKFLTQKVRVLDVGRVPRQEVTDRQEAIDGTLATMRNFNHPATQFLDQLKHQHSEDISASIFKELDQDIATVVGWDVMESIYESQIAIINTPKSRAHLTNK